MTNLSLQENMIPVNKNQEYINNWLLELDSYYKLMGTFSKMQPDDIFRNLSNWSARASHIRSQVNRTNSKVFQGFRTSQIDPFLNECQYQFKVWSRVFSVAQMDASLSMGRYT